MNTEVILGAGGSGKSTLLRERIESDPQYALLTASTGIAAVNLGDKVTTIHSALGFYDTRGAADAYHAGRIKRKALTFADRGKKNVVIDEISTVGADVLQYIHCGFEDAARERREAGKDSTGLILVGDFLQLPPVPDKPGDKIKYAFEAECWQHYASNITQLKTIYRQTNPAFLEALQLFRSGRGVDGALALQKLGVEFVKESDTGFDGITLMPTNKQVENYNERKLAELPGEVVAIPSVRWGKERGEWKNIPQVLQVKDGAQVMVLVNQPGTFEYVNGDLGVFCVERVSHDDPARQEAAEIFGETEDMYTVETKRGYIGSIPFTIRRNILYEDSYDGTNYKCAFENSLWGRKLENESRGSKRFNAICLEYQDAHTMQGEPYYDPRERGVVVGEVEYMPLRLAYASSFHKVQGLTLDKCQVDIRHYWASNPGMVYVALTRVRSVEGLRIVGDVRTLAKRTCTDARVRGYV